jgi:hypothetical protein
MALRNLVPYGAWGLNYVRESEVEPPATVILLAAGDGKFWWIRDPAIPDGVFPEPPHKLVSLHGEPWEPKPHSFLTALHLAMYGVGPKVQKVMGAIEHWKEWKDKPCPRPGKPLRRWWRRLLRVKR